jgi:hypothetical protein
MPTKETSFTQLAHDVVQAAPAPLPFAEIVDRVNKIRPIPTKNPKQTIRGVIGQSQMIVSTGDGRYGWKPRLANGAVIRHTIQAAETAQNRLYWDRDLWGALWPTFSAPSAYNDRSPAQVALPTGTQSDFALDMFSPGTWGTPATAGFWDWFHGLGAAPGDHLLFTVIDGEARQYQVVFQPRAARDEPAIAARNQALIEIGLKLGQRPYSITSWDLTTYLLATGFYRHPVPPDPFSELWSDEIMTRLLYGEEEAPPSVPQKADRLVSDFFGQPAPAYDYENPPALPREYDPDYGRRHARQSRKAHRGSVVAYTLRVNHRALPEVWRDIELAEDNTLEDLHLTIQSAFGWNDDHLYSFFLSSKRDGSVEIGSPWSDTAWHTHQVEMAQLDLAEGRSFLYFFDYGDSHEFDITVLAVNELAPKANYPRILNYHGQAPPQYPDVDEETGQMSWDPYRHWRP